MVLIECFSPVKATDGTADEVNEEVEFKAFTGGEEGAVKKKDELPIVVQAVCQTVVNQDSSSNRSVHNYNHVTTPDRAKMNLGELREVTIKVKTMNKEINQGPTANVKRSLP